MISLWQSSTGLNIGRARQSPALTIKDQTEASNLIREFKSFRIVLSRLKHFKREKKSKMKSFAIFSILLFCFLAIGVAASPKIVGDFKKSIASAMKAGVPYATVMGPLYAPGKLSFEWKASNELIPSRAVSSFDLIWPHFDLLVRKLLQTPWNVHNQLTLLLTIRLGFNILEKCKFARSLISSNVLNGKVTDYVF